MSTVLLRAAGTADVPAIAEFQTTCWREAYQGLVPQEYLDRVGTAQRVTRWHERLVTGAREVAVALLAGEVVGVVSWGWHGSARAPGQPAAPRPALELMSLYVGAGQRGTGLAARLLEHATGQQPAYLWVFSGNHRAQSFYRKHGFRPDGHRQTDPDTGLPEERYVRP